VSVDSHCCSAWRTFTIDDRRTHPREATRTPGRSLAADWSPAPRRPPAGHTDPPGATRPSSPDAGSGAPATPPFAAPVPNPRGDVRVRDLTVQRVRGGGAKRRWRGSLLMRWLDSPRDARKACELKQSFIDWKRPPHATESMRANSKKPKRGSDQDLFCKVSGHEAFSDDLRCLFTVVEQVTGPND
jgi:hypothetical protein